jgi:hypothetical protein
MIPSVCILKLEVSLLKWFISLQIQVMFRKSSLVNKSNVFLNYLRNIISIESWPISSSRHDGTKSLWVSGNWKGALKTCASNGPSRHPQNFILHEEYYKRTMVHLWTAVKNLTTSIGVMLPAQGRPYLYQLKGTVMHYERKLNLAWLLFNNL